MTLECTETVEPGQIKVSRKSTEVFGVLNIGASVVVMLYDVVAKVGGIAHIVLPDSSVNPAGTDGETPGKYADTAIPALFEAYLEAGGQLSSTIVMMAGGAQLFNFGGGSGNPLNIGARCATAIKTSLMRNGLTVNKEDIGGNKARRLRYILSAGQAMVTPIGEAERPLG